MCPGIPGKFVWAPSSQGDRGHLVTLETAICLADQWWGWTATCLPLRTGEWRGSCASVRMDARNVPLLTTTDTEQWRHSPDAGGSAAPRGADRACWSRARFPRRLRTSRPPASFPARTSGGRAVRCRRGPAGGLRCGQPVRGRLAPWPAFSVRSSWE